MDISASNESISSVLDIGRRRFHHRSSPCLTGRSADKYASRMALERYDVESCGESLIVHELFLVRSPGVFTPLLFVCEPEFLINISECLGSASITILSGAFQTVVHPNVSPGSEIVLHTRQGVVVEVPMLQCVSRVNVCSTLP